jgi:septal ring factor EnvC (AmiA/AmiB activator)
MSPIGRVFIVINLVLAGAFVMIAGTFLQRHTDYKGRFENATAAAEKDKAAAESQRAELADKLATTDRELRAKISALETAKTESASLSDENKRLQGQLADLATDI